QNIEGHTGDSFVLIRYDPPGNMRGSTLKGYQLFRGTTPSNARLLIKLGPEVNEYNDTSVINRNTYHYHVIAVCDVWGVEKLSERSDMVSFSPKDPPVVKVREPPSPPVNIRHSLLKDNAILSWDPPVHDGNSSVFRYNVYRSEDGGDMNYIGNTSVQTFTDMDLARGITYRYSITALNIIGESDMSDTVEILLEEDAPSQPGAFPIWAIILPVIILMVVVAAVGILLWKRRSPPLEEGSLSLPPPTPISPNGQIPP
ncbi:MAG: fibronectin type III domain-containing protein, partial [Candidatus Thermoplasmatota archaeon]|nr:fibronectin type III domain-containing protein [Candidatus Thermoplasmatota archaeon]